MNWTLNGCEFTWKGLGYFGIGAAAGLLGAGIGAGISSAIAGTSFGAGFIGSSAAGVAGSSFLHGAAIGLGSGGASGFVTGFGNSLLEKNGFGKSLVNGIIGMGVGAGSAALIGGLTSGLDAVLDGRRFMDGAKVEYPKIHTQEGIPNVWGNSKECMLACLKAENIASGLGNTEEDILACIVLGDDGYTNAIRTMQNYAELTGRNLMTYNGNGALEARIAFQNDNVVFVNLDMGDGPGHTVLLKGLHAKTVTKLNGTTNSSMFWDMMNPSRSNWTELYWNRFKVPSNQIFVIY
jgi:hypothetical protein